LNADAGVGAELMSVDSGSADDDKRLEQAARQQHVAIERVNSLPAAMSLPGGPASVFLEKSAMKTFNRVIRAAAILGALFVAGFVDDAPPQTWLAKGISVSQAGAVVGHPRTPRSAAGRARRHGY
jgi:hypothetical protein